jgi:hypothetical protein
MSGGKLIGVIHWRKGKVDQIGILLCGMSQLMVSCSQNLTNN